MVSSCALHVLSGKIKLSVLSAEAGHVLRWKNSARGEKFSQNPDRIQMKDYWISSTNVG